MSPGLALLVVEALAVYAIVFATHAARDRVTLMPYFGLLGVLAAMMRWTTDAGLLYEVGPFTFVVGSTVFFTAILLGFFLVYLFDGVQAAQISIFVVVSVSILSPATALLFRYQIVEIGGDGAPLGFALSSLRTYVSSTSAMLIDFLSIAMVWEFLGRHADRMPNVARLLVCLLSTFWLDSLIFCTGAFWGEAEFGAILSGNLLSRAVLAAIVTPALAAYIQWVRQCQYREFTPREVMAILSRSARREFDLVVMRRELEERRRVEEVLRRRDAILEALAFAVEHTLSRRGDPGDMLQVLQSLGAATRVSRAYICENRTGAGGMRTMTVRCCWEAPERTGEPGPPQWENVEYRKAGFLRWEQMLGSGEAVAGDVKTFPREEQRALLSRGVVSVLVLPVFVAEEWWGFIGLDECERARSWPRTEIDALRTAARTLGAAIQRGRTEAALGASRERLDLALAGGDLGLWDWEIARDRVVFNERWAGMLGYTLDEIETSTRAWERLMYPEDMDRIRPVMRAHLKGLTPSFEFESRMRASDGTWRWVLNKGKVVSRDEDGRASRATGTHLDITRLKETENALRVSQAMYRLMFEASPLGLILCGMDGGFVEANPAFLQIVNYTAEEIRNRTYYDISPRDFETEELAVYGSMQATGRYGPIEFAYIRKEGGRVPVIVNGSLVTGADGKQYVWSIVEDISARKSAEQAITAARAYQREVETRIEETLLRGRPPSDLSGVDVAAINVPTEHVDGDFADFVRLTATCFDVLVGDVMGKGILAALVSAGAKSHFLRALSMQLAEADRGVYPSPAGLVHEVHRRITRQLIELDCFLTLCYARFDLAAGRVTYVDCGHTKTVRFRVPAHACTLLEGDNVPIGFLETERYREREADLAPGDVFCFYSDGITEARNSAGAMFGVERLVDALKLHASLDAAAIARKLLDTAGQFTGTDVRADDQTCVVVKVSEGASVESGGLALLRIDASVNELVAARTFLQDYLDRRASLLGDPSVFPRVVLAFIEALSNVIKHAGAGESAKSIGVEARSSRNRLAITITHGGAHFLPRCTPLPDPKQKKESGYGLYIMNRCFTHIGYESANGEQCITLVKHFSG